MTLGELITQIELQTGTSITDPAVLGYDVIMTVGVEEENVHDVMVDGRDNTVTLA